MEATTFFAPETDCFRYYLFLSKIIPQKQFTEKMAEKDDIEI